MLLKINLKIKVESRLFIVLIYDWDDDCTKCQQLYKENRDKSDNRILIKFREMLKFSTKKTVTIVDIITNHGQIS